MMEQLIFASHKLCEIDSWREKIMVFFCWGQGVQYPRVLGHFVNEVRAYSLLALLRFCADY